MVIPLLRSLYDTERPCPGSWWESAQTMHDMELFAIHAQVYHLPQTTHRLDPLPEEVLSKLKARHTQGMYQNLVMKHKETEALELLDKHGLEVIPLKGVRFAERYFGHYAARITSDMDLLVRAERLQEAIACLVVHGYDFEIIKDHHARPHKDGMMVEPHWTLDKRDWSDLDPESFWHSATAVNGYRHVKELTPLHTFYFICLHGARHQMDSVRYLIDIVQMLHTHSRHIDYGRLMELTSVDKTSKRIQAVLSIVYQQFPHLQTFKPLPFDLLDTHWDYDTVRGGRLGRKTKGYYQYKLFFRHFLFDTLKHQIRSIRKAY